MKISKLAASALLAALAASAFPALAQASTPGQQPATRMVPAGTKDGVPGITGAPATGNLQQTSGQWVAPYGQPIHEKTRAEVYQELVQAEQDGQLAYLNSTLYAH